MNARRHLGFVLLSLLSVSAGCIYQNKTLAQLQTVPIDPLQGGNPVARVLIFVSNDCPIANRYAPVVKRLHERYAPRGIAFCFVHCDPTETDADIRAHDRDYRLDLPTLRDPHQSLVRPAKAEVVPSAAVFAAEGGLLYHGRIDDRFAEIGRERQEPTRRDLQEALESILAHRPIKVKATKAVGCYLPSAR
jgi:hypothetical protein